MAKVTQTFTLGDTLSIPNAVLKEKNSEGNEVAIDLTGKTVSFRMVMAKTPNTVILEGATADIDDATNGKVSYQWQPADVDTAGTYICWFILTDGGATEHFPSDYSYSVIIHPRDGSKLDA